MGRRKFNKLERVKALKKKWDVENPEGLAEQFVAHVVYHFAESHRRRNRLIERDHLGRDGDELDSYGWYFYGMIVSSR